MYVVVDHYLVELNLVNNNSRIRIHAMEGIVISHKEGLGCMCELYANAKISTKLLQTVIILNIYAFRIRKFT